MVSNVKKRIGQTIENSRAELENAREIIEIAKRAKIPVGQQETELEKLEARVSELESAVAE